MEHVQMSRTQDVQLGDRATGTLVDPTLETGEPATSSELMYHTVW